GGGQTTRHYRFPWMAFWPLIGRYHTLPARHHRGQKAKRTGAPGRPLRRPGGLSKLSPIRIEPSGADYPMIDTPLLREIVAEAEAKGEAKGEAKAKANAKQEDIASFLEARFG